LRAQKLLVTFDLDGVLIKNPFRDGVFPEVGEILKKQFIDIHGFTPPNLKKDIIHDIFNEFRENLKSNKPYLAYDWDRVIQKVASNMGCPGNIDIADLVKKYCKFPYIYAYKEVDKVLDWLKQRKDCRLAVITNGYYIYQYPVLKTLGLDKYFEEIIVPEIIKNVKPGRDMFLKVYKNDDIWYHIGDSLLQDVYGANRIGIKSIWIQRDMPKGLTKLNPSERIKSKEGYMFFKGKLDKELQLKDIKSNDKEIMPEYIISSLQELKKVIIN